MMVSKLIFLAIFISLSWQAWSAPIAHFISTQPHPDTEIKTFVQVHQNPQTPDEFIVAETEFGGGKFPEKTKEYIIHKNTMQEKNPRGIIDEIKQILGSGVLVKNQEPSIIWQGVATDPSTKLEPNFNWKWSEDNELRYSAWVKSTFKDADFFRKRNFPTNCADVPFAARWIFAAMNQLPIKFKLNGNFEYSHLSKEAKEVWAGKKLTVDQLFKNAHFMNSLRKLLHNTFTFDIPNNSYGINFRTLDPKHQKTIYEKFLVEGVINLTGAHSMIIIEASKAEGHLPFMFASSTLPAAVRSLSIYPFTILVDLRTFDQNILNHKDATSIVDKTLYNASKKMPFKMMEMSEFFKIYNINLTLDIIHQGYKETILQLLEERLEITKKSLKYCNNNELSKNNDCLIESKNFEDYSTPGRDGRLLHLHQNIMEMAYKVANQTDLNIINQQFDFSFALDENEQHVISTWNFFNSYHEIVFPSSNPLAPFLLRWKYFGDKAKPDHQLMLSQLSSISQMINTLKNKDLKNNIFLHTLRSLEYELRKILIVINNVDQCVPLKFSSENVEENNTNLVNQNLACTAEIEEIFNLKNLLTYFSAESKKNQENYDYKNKIFIKNSNFRFKLNEYSQHIFINGTHFLNKITNQIDPVNEVIQNQNLDYCEEIYYHEATGNVLLECYMKRSFQSFNNERLLYIFNDKKGPKESINNIKNLFRDDLLEKHLNYTIIKDQIFIKDIFSTKVLTLSLPFHQIRSKAITHQDSTNAIKWYIYHGSYQQSKNKVIGLLDEKNFSIKIQFENSSIDDFSINVKKEEFEIIKQSQLNILTPIFFGQGPQQNHGIILNSFTSQDAIFSIPSVNKQHQVYKTNLSKELFKLLEESFFVKTTNFKDFTFLVTKKYPGGTVQLSLDQMLDSALHKTTIDSLFKQWFSQESYADGLLIAKYAKPYFAQLFYRGSSMKLPTYPGLVFNSTFVSSSEFIFFRHASIYEGEIYGVEINPSIRSVHKYITGKNKEQISLSEPTFLASNPQQFSKDALNFYLSTTISDSFIKRKKFAYQSIEENIISEYGATELFNSQQISRVFESKDNGVLELVNEKIDFKDCKISNISQEMVRLTESAFTNVCGEYWILYY